MLKKVKKATREYATSETLVWWDMDTCPLPNGYDPSRLGPRIDTELKNLGYNGPLTIIAIGDLYGIPSEFLEVLSSNGFVIKHTGTGLYPDMLGYFIPRSRLCQPPPVTIMIISASSGLLEQVTGQIYVRPECGYNLLLAYPPNSEPKQPHPSSFVRFGGEWLWDRASLLKGSANEEETRRLDKGGSEFSFSCRPCYVFCSSFEDFTSHLESIKHECKVEVYNDDRDFKFQQYLKKLEAAKRTKPYLARLRSKQLSFKRLHEHCTAEKTKRLKTQQVVSSLPKNSTAKTRKAKDMENIEEFESSLPKNTKGKEQSKSKKLKIQGEYMVLRSGLVL